MKKKKNKLLMLLKNKMLIKNKNYKLQEKDTMNSSKNSEKISNLVSLKILEIELNLLN